MNVSDPFPLVYFGSKYFIVALSLWLTIHTMFTTKKARGRLYYDYQPWLTRHPEAMIALALVLDTFLLFALNNMKPEYQQPYDNLLIAGAPIFYTWSALIAIMLTALGALYMYRRQQMRLGAALTGACIMLASIVAPYYFPF